jgi:hypothetical protein
MQSNYLTLSIDSISLERRVMQCKLEVECLLDGKSAFAADVEFTYSVVYVFVIRHQRNSAEVVCLVQ